MGAADAAPVRLRRWARPGAQPALRLSGVHTRDMRALCAVLPAGVSRAGRPLELETRLRLRNGSTRAITPRQRWRCVRGRKGEFNGIRPINRGGRPPVPAWPCAGGARGAGDRGAARPFWSRHEPAAARPSRVESSLWQLRIAGTAGGPAQAFRNELRARRSRTVRLTLPAPGAARGRVSWVTAGADSARRASARRCARIAGAPRFTG